MPKVIEGVLSAAGCRFALVAGRFNSFITTKLVDGALDAIVRHGGRDEDVTLIWVPGAYEIPAALGRVVASAKYDAVITLGAVIRGGTPHFDYVANEVSKGVASVALGAPIPISFGVLTCDTIEQAIERAGAKAGNKGFEAATAAIELVNLYKSL